MTDKMPAVLGPDPRQPAHPYDLLCKCEECAHFKQVLMSQHLGAEMARRVVGRREQKLKTTTYRRPPILQYIREADEDSRERILKLVAEATYASAATRRQWQQALKERGWADA